MASNNSEAADSREIGTLETSKDEKPMETLIDEKSFNIGPERDKSDNDMPAKDDQLNVEACERSAETEEAVLEKEDFVSNSSKGGSEIEKAGEKFKAEGHGHVSEAKTGSHDILTEKNVELEDESEELRHVTESLAKDEIKVTKINNQEESYNDQTIGFEEEQTILRDFGGHKDKMNQKIEPNSDAEKDNEKTEDILSEEVTDPDLTTLRNLEAKYSDRRLAEEKSNIVEELGQDSEELSMTKKLQKESKEAIEKPVDRTSIACGLSEEKAEQEAKADDHTDAAPTMIIEERTLRGQLDDRSVEAVDDTSDARNSDMVKSIDVFQQDEEVENVKLEGSSSMVSQPPVVKHESMDTHSTLLEISDANSVRVEETITPADVSESGNQGVKQIYEAATILSMQEASKNEIGQEIDEDPSESANHNVAVVPDDEMIHSEILPAGKAEEQLKVPSFALNSNEQEETITAIKNIEHESITKDDSEANNMKVEEIPVMESRLPISALESASDAISQKSDKDEVEREESRTTSDSRDQGYKEIHETRTNPTVQNTDSDKADEEIKEGNQKISEPLSHNIEPVADAEITHVQPPLGDIAEEQLQPPSLVLDPKEQEEITTTIKKIEGDWTQKDVTEIDNMMLEGTSVIEYQLPTSECKNADSASSEKLAKDDLEKEGGRIVHEFRDMGFKETHETVTSQSAEIEGIREVIGEISEPQFQDVEITGAENIVVQTPPTDLTEEKFQEPPLVLNRNEENTITATIEKIEGKKTKKEINNMKVEETSVILPSTECKNASNATSEPSNKYNDEQEESRMAFGSLDQGFPKPHETLPNQDMQHPGTDNRDEEIKEVIENISEEQSQDFVVVQDAEIIHVQPPPADAIEEQPQVPTLVLNPKEEDGTMITNKMEDERTEEDKTKVDNMKLAETSALESQLPTTECENAKNATLVKSIKGKDEMEERVMVSEYMDKDLERSHETLQSQSVQDTVTGSGDEEIKEVIENLSESQLQDIAADAEIINVLTPSADEMALLRVNPKEEDETATTIEKIEDERTKKDTTAFDNMKLQENSALEFQIPITKCENANNATSEKSIKDKEEQGESISISESQDQGFERTHEALPSQSVQHIVTGSGDEEIKEVSEEVIETQFQDVEAVADAEIFNAQTPPAHETGLLQVNPKEEDEIATTIDKIEDKRTEKDITEFDNIKLAETSAIESQLPLTECKNTENATSEKLIKDKQEESIMDIESKDRGFESTCEALPSPSVQDTVTGTRDEEIKEVAQKALEPHFQYVEAVADAEIMKAQTSPADATGVLQVNPKEEDETATTTTVKMIEDERRKKDITEIENKKLAESPAIEFQLPTRESMNANNATSEKSVKDEATQEETIMVSESQDQGLERIHDTLPSQSVQDTVTGTGEEEIKEVSDKVSQPQFQDVAVIADAEIILDQPSSASTNADQIQVPLSALNSKEQDTVPTVMIEKIEEGSIRSDEIAVEKMRAKEIVVVEPQSPTSEYGNAKNPASEELNHGENGARVSIRMSETKDQHFEEIETRCPTAPDIDIDALDKDIKEVIGGIAEPQTQDVEEVAEAKVNHDQPLPTGKLDEQLQVSVSTVPSLVKGTGTTTASAKTEDERDATEVVEKKLENTSGMVPKLPVTEHDNMDNTEKLDPDKVEVEESTSSEAISTYKIHDVEETEIESSMITEKTRDVKVEEEIEPVPATMSRQTSQGEEKGVQFQVPSLALTSEGQDSETTTTTNKTEDETGKTDEREVDSMKVEKISAMLSQPSRTEHENDNHVTGKGSEINELEEEETKTKSEFKDRGYEEIHEIKTTGPGENTSLDIKDNDINEGTENESELGYQGAIVADAEISSCQPLPPRKSEHQLQEPSLALPSSDIKTAAATVEKIEDDCTKTDETPFDKDLEETTRMVSKLPTIEDENADKILKSDAADIEIEESESSGKVFQSEVHHAEQIQETAPNFTLEKTCRDEVEGEISAVPEKTIEPNSQGVEAVTNWGITPNNTLPAETLENQLTETSSALVRGQQHVTTTAVEMVEYEGIEKDETKVDDNAGGDFAYKIDNSCLQNEGLSEASHFELKAKDNHKGAPEEESIAVEEATGSEPQEYIPEINFAASVKKFEETYIHNSQHKDSRYEDTTDQGNLNKEASDDLPLHPITKELITEEVNEKSEEAFNPMLEKTEQVLESKSEIQSLKVPILPEAEIREEQLETTRTEPKDDKDQSGEIAVSDGTSGTKTNSYREKVGDENQTAEEPVSAHKESVKKSDQKDELQAEERGYEMLQSQEYKIQIEEFSEGPGKASVNEDIKETITGEGITAMEPYQLQDRAPVSPMEEKDKVKDVEDAPVGMDVEARDDTNVFGTLTEAIGLIKEKPQLLLEENDKGRTGNCEEDTDTSKDEEKIKDPGFPSDTDAAKEAKHETSQKTDGAPEPVPIESTHDSIGTYGVNKEIANADLRKPEDIIKKEEPKHTSPAPVAQEADVTEILNVKEQEFYTHKSSISSSIEASQEDIAGKDSEDSVDEKQCDKPVTNEMVGEKEKSTQSEEEETKNKEPVELSTMGNEGKLDEANIHSIISIYKSEDQNEKSNAFPHIKGSCPEGPNEEKEVAEGCEETAEKFTIVDSAKLSLPDLMQKSTRESPQVAAHLIQEKELTANKKEQQNVGAEAEQAKEPKTDEENDQEGDEHRRTDSGSDAPVMVEASTDVDIKHVHKKSHNILSGVGSKVKHSIAKVKKVITGKSSHSHPKPPSPRIDK